MSNSKLHHTNNLGQWACVCLHTYASNIRKANADTNHLVPYSNNLVAATTAQIKASGDKHMLATLNYWNHIRILLLFKRKRTERKWRSTLFKKWD